MNAEVMIDGQDGEDMSLVQDVDESGSNSSKKSMYGKIEIKTINLICFANRWHV